MGPSPLSWICSFLILNSVFSVAAQQTLINLPNEMQLAILQRFVVSQKFDFCGYVDWLAVNRWAYSHTDVGLPMFTKAAKQEKNLKLSISEQRVKKQQILKNVRIFSRIRSNLPVFFKETGTNELRRWAEVFESMYQVCSSYSESSTWRKACMAGLFGRNTLITLLPHLSEDFCSHNKDILLQTAFFVGDIDSLKAIVDSFEIPKEEVPAKVPEFDIVFSGSVSFLEELVKFLPNLMERRLDLIREASFLNRLDLVTNLLKGTKPFGPHELKHILDSFCLLKMFENDSLRSYYTGDKRPYYVLRVVAEYDNLAIIRLLWPMMETMPKKAEATIKKMMIGASEKNHRSVLEFLMRQSGKDYMKMAQKYMNEAFEAAVGGGSVELMDFFRGDDDAGNPVAPGLGLTTLSLSTLCKAIQVNRNWNGIKYLVDLQTKGDSRFENFKLVDQDNAALRMACKVGNYELVEYLLQKNRNGQFVFTLTNPAVKRNKPLADACGSGNLQIVQKLLERDASGKYIYKGIDPSDRSYECVYKACIEGHWRVVKFLLKMKDEKYVLPGMNDVNIAKGLMAASKWSRMKIVRFLLKMDNGTYVLPAINCIDLTRILKIAIEWDQIKVVRFLLGQALDGSYLHPRVKVTEDMLTPGGLRPEVRGLLEMHLRQRRSEA